MSLKVAVQMDPIQSVNIESDTTFMLALEAQARGHVLWVYQPEHLALENGRVSARARSMTLRAEKGNHVDLGAEIRLDLHDDVDVVLLRQDPPFDMAYITTTFMLELIHPATLVVNDPFHVRNAPEKLFVTHFPDLMPETLISASVAQLRQFRDKHGESIVKPLFGSMGLGMLRVADPETAFRVFRALEAIRAVYYLQRTIEHGGRDVRAFVVGDRVVGAIERSAVGWRTNVSRGARRRAA